MLSTERGSGLEPSVWGSDFQQSLPGLKYRPCLSQEVTLLQDLKFKG